MKVPLSTATLAPVHTVPYTRTDLANSAVRTLRDNVPRVLVTPSAEVVGVLFTEADELFWYVVDGYDAGVRQAALSRAGTPQ